MASKHKHRPTLSSIPIPSNDESIPYFQTPRTVLPKAVIKPRASSLSAPKPPEDDWSSTDPDDLFVRFTISEIRTIQAKLRADADAKQEELRLMVGERYRDLLQASTSIISIADSSHRVMGALTEMRGAMAPEEPQRKPRSSSIRGKDDTHLKTLQSLSAHLKLLLDAPEHLWRLMEKRQHLQAAWLFLLARVVHRALVRDDSGEESWEDEGINVLAQFPLVQRQWDTVAQFRSQIAHRATQYLRERSVSSERACSTVLTLHLLDSLPLADTLSTLLSQRFRTLNALLARNLDIRSVSRPGSPILKSRRKNREVAGLLFSPVNTSLPQRSRNRNEVMKDVRGATVELLDVISGTMSVARDIFRAEASETEKSLVERSLEDIQSDVPSNSVLTTSSLLATLPSSTHVLMLPPSILSYKPYIDLTSPSAHVHPGVLDAKLSEWFDKAMHGFEGRVHAWFEGLESIREVWGVRRNVLERLRETRGLEQREMTKVRTVLDDGVKGRIGEVAKAALDDVEERLDDALRRAVRNVREGVEESRLDINPSTFLFSPPPIPPVSQASTSPGPVISSFKRFKDALRQRADGRTLLLDRVLSDVEIKAREIESDLNEVNEDDDESRILRDEIMATHHPTARASSIRIVQILERYLEHEISNVEQDPERNVLVFLGRVSHNISSSNFIQSLRCQDDAVQAFQVAMADLHTRSLKYWREYVVSKAFTQCKLVFALPENASTDSEFTWPSKPSPQLTTSLLFLTSSIRRLGLSRAKLDLKEIPRRSLHDFKTAVAGGVPEAGYTWRREHAQLMWDLTFLRRLSEARQSGIKEAVKAGDALAPLLTSLQSQLQSCAPEEVWRNFEAHIDHSLEQYLSRSQTLLAPLLSVAPAPEKLLANGDATKHALAPGSKPTALLPLGTPALEQDFKPAIEIVKPSARFGLLLVGSTAMR